LIDGIPIAARSSARAGASVRRPARSLAERARGFSSNSSGDGPTALQQIRAIGNDMALDPGVGNCGKAGQWVPVGVGQPTLLIGGLTVGGSAA